MKKDKRKLLNRIVSLAAVAAILVALGTIPANVSAQEDYLVLEWSADTGSDVLSIDISNGHVYPSELYVVAGSERKLSLYNGTGTLKWYQNIQIADYWAYGTSHGVAISGDAQYVVAGDTRGYFRIYNINGVLIRTLDLSNGPCYSVDVSNPLRNENNEAYAVACSGDWFYVYNASSGDLLWSQELIVAGSVINVGISENGHWIAVSSNNHGIEFHNNTDPSQHQMVWCYNTTDPVVNIAIGRNGTIVVAGEDDPSNGGTSNVYEFDVGNDGVWDVGDGVPRWSRAEPRDIYAVAVSDTEWCITPIDFSVISGNTWNDNESEESYYYSSDKIRNWSTGVVWSAAATYDNQSAYNFRLFGSFDHNVYLVSQASDDIVDTYTTGGTVNAVGISFAYHQSCYYYDYFVAGSADGYVYFFTYDYS
jgi:hypothetical protein